MTNFVETTNILFMSYYYPGAFIVYPPDFIFFVTITVIDWVDVFTREEYKKIIVESLDFCRRKKGLSVYAWVLMTNHIHLIISHKDGTEKLAAVIGDFKKFTSKAVVRAIIDNPKESRKKWLLMHFDEETIKGNDDASCSVSKSNRSDGIMGASPRYHLWQRSYHRYCVYNIKHMRQKLDYLHANPIRAGIVDKPWEYRYSSYRNYCGEEGLMEIDFAQIGIDDPTSFPKW